MNKKAAYVKQELKEYECGECQKTYKGKETEEHVKKHLEAIIKGTSMDKKESKGQALGVLGMLITNTI